MDSILEKAQRAQVKELNSKLDDAVGGLRPGSPERRAALKKALDDISAAVPREEGRRAVWDFSAEKAQTILVEDEKIIIRSIQLADADFYMSVRAQYSMMYRAVIHMGKVDNESVLKTDVYKPEVFYCVIEDAKGATPVGYIAITDTRREIWEIAIEIDGQFIRRGFGLRSIRLFLNEIHRITGCSEYRALVETDNLPSQMCFEKLGARLAGLCSGPVLKSEDEKWRFEENNLNLIDDSMKKLAARLGVEPRKLLSHVLDYRIECPI